VENLAPSLILLWDVKRALECGHSAGKGVKCFLARANDEASDDVFHFQTRTWWNSLSNPNIQFERQRIAPHRRMLLELIEAGLRGQPISAALKNIEAELILSCEDEIAAHVARLPLILLFPLLGLVFPSMLMLFILPVLDMLRF
jgi:hypothetical protein